MLNVINVGDIQRLIYDPKPSYPQLLFPEEYISFPLPKSNVCSNPHAISIIYTPNVTNLGRRTIGSTPLLSNANCPNLLLPHTQSLLY